MIVVDPRFTRSAAVADYYAPIRTGTDIAFLGGVINYLLTNDKIQHEYVKAYTDASFIVRRGLRLRGRPVLRLRRRTTRKYDQATWSYEIGHGRLRQGRPDAAASALRLQLLKQHYSRYTPEMVSNICGTPKEQFLKVCEMIADDLRARPRP